MKSYRPWLLAILISANISAAPSDETHYFTVLHTNDSHGHFWQNERGEYGFPAQKTVIDSIRQEVESQGNALILLHAGDYNTGVPESDLLNAIPDIEGLNAMGYEAVALGNHEFDFPLNQLLEQQKQAKFALVSANVLSRETEKPLVNPYIVLQKGALKIAVMGLTTEDTAKLSNPEATAEVVFKPAIKTAQETLKIINEHDKPDVRIALTHMGYYNDAQHGQNAPGDVSLARAVKEGDLDIIIGGHTHNTVCIDENGALDSTYIAGKACKPDLQNGVYIMQAGSWGKYVGRADFKYSNGKTELLNYQLIPINLKQKIKGSDGENQYVLYTQEIAQDPELFAQLKPYEEEGRALLNIKVGEIKGKFEGDREIIRSEQTNLGRLIAQSQMQRVNADLGLMNSGGIRNSLNEGVVTYRDLLLVQPFGNMIATVQLNGQELKEYLTFAALRDQDSGGYPQFAGLSMTVNRAKGEISDVKIAGKPLDEHKLYTLSLPDYIAGGGDGYPILKDNPSYVNTGFIDAEMLKRYFNEHKILDAEKFDPKNDIIFQ